MNLRNSDKIILIIKNNTDSAIEQKKTKKPQDKLEFKSTKTICTFQLNPRLELEEKKTMISVTNVEVANSVFRITETNNIFTIYTLRFWGDPEII